ncbi:GntR family transcriptional regulator [Rubrivirga sp. IMCC45206]|uniref:GntR family transcriptional regulator n=1 Tax=Rubrivirga sp. IMCC45206 TaxID=3391614 RepID=UPI00398FB9CD
MIELDRDAPLPLADQLVGAMRYEIAAGRYRPGSRLPSTRALGDQLGISFHTARKAYQKLAQEGIVDVRRGGGYVVVERQALSRAERLERGAGVVETALHELVGLGLGDDEVEYVVQEGLQFFERPGTRRALYFAASYRELAESGAEQASAALQERVQPMLLSELGALDAVDGLVVALPDLRAGRRARPGAEVVGAAVMYAVDVLERIASLGPGESLGVVTRHPDAVAPLSDEIRQRTGFAGPLLALPVDADKRQLETVVRQSDLVVFTPQARRRIRPVVQRLSTPAAEMAPTLAPASLTRLRDALAG